MQRVPHSTFVLQAIQRPSHSLERHPIKNQKRFTSTRSIGFDNESLYHAEADRVMDVITDLCDNLFDVTDDDFDFKTASGVLNIDFGSKGVFVINKQAPNRELWLSSPISGPYHFQYNREHSKWISSKDGTCLFDVLNSEIAETVGSDVNFA